MTPWTRTNRSTSLTECCSEQTTTQANEALRDPLAIDRPNQVCHGTLGQIGQHQPRLYAAIVTSIAPPHRGTMAVGRCRPTILEIDGTETAVSPDLCHGRRRVSTNRETGPMPTPSRDRAAAAFQRTAARQTGRLPKEGPAADMLNSVLHCSNRHSSILTPSSSLVT